MEIDLTKTKCSNPDCKVAETGKCIEGFELGECQHLIKVIDEDDTIQENEDENQLPEEELSRNPIQLNGGSILSLDEATEVLCEGESRVLALLGSVNSGKSTLCLSLYNAFQNGAFEMWNFGGSQTLTAFEERSFLSRAASGRVKSDTPRTSLGEGLGFYHLKLTNNRYCCYNLLISDRSGEYYASVADSFSDCTSLFEIKRADLALFLLDGEKITTDERHSIKTDMLMLIETLIESGIIGHKHNIGIALSKYDLVLKSEYSERAICDFDNLFDTTCKRFADKVLSIEKFEVAARSQHSNIKSLYGIDNILKKMLCEKPKTYQPNALTFKSNRSYSNYTLHKGNTNE